MRISVPEIAPRARVRSRKREDINCDAEVAHYSSALCHLANISYRLGRTLHFDATSYSCTGDEEANRMRSRALREPWRV